MQTELLQQCSAVREVAVQRPLLAAWSAMLQTPQRKRDRTCEEMRESLRKMGRGTGRRRRLLTTRAELMVTCSHRVVKQGDRGKESFPEEDLRDWNLAGNFAATQGASRLPFCAARAPTPST